MRKLESIAFDTLMVFLESDQLFGPPFYEITARSGEDTAKLRWPKLFF
ncbi:MAG: hypothetical protein ACP5US_03215 [Candidatus Kryptoniota bacterium]